MSAEGDRANSRSSRRGGWLSAVVLACAWSADAASGQLPARPGPLSNDSFVPTSAAATEQLRLGDAEWLRALEGGAAADLAWTRTFEAWHGALELSATGDNVPVGLLLSEQDATVESYVAAKEARFPDRDHSFERRTEAVEYAVLRRLCGLEPGEIASWTTRFEPLAQAWLRQASAEVFTTSRHTATLRELERRFPATRAAASAALQLLELELEAGRLRLANTWLERARLHADLVGGDARRGLDEALSSREAFLNSLAPRQKRAPEPWNRAREFTPGDGHSLDKAGHYKPRSMARILGQPGLAFLNEGRVAVQTTGITWVLAPLDPGRDEDRGFEPHLLAEELRQPISAMAERTGKDWPMFPVAEGENVYLVCGRADGMNSNFVIKVRTPRDLELPLTVWCLGGNGLDGPEGGHEPLGDVLEEGMWEFQPGPLLVDDLLLLQARQWTRIERDGEQVLATPGEARSWLLALDANTGKPRWKFFLGRGTDLVHDFGNRFGRQSLIRTPASALEVTERCVFVGTNLGAGFLIDLADGRLRWSFRNRRRANDDRGWKTGARPKEHKDSSAGPPVLLWAPADGDELYPLASALDFAPPNRGEAAPFVPYPPLPIGECEELLGGSPRSVLTFGRAGPRRTLSVHDLTTGSRFDSIYLGREENFLTGALLSDDHVLFVADGGLYLLDRGRELYLESFHPLAIESDFAAGGLWARGDELYLLAQGALYFFEMK